MFSDYGFVLTYAGDPQLDVVFVFVFLLGV